MRKGDTHATSTTLKTIKRTAERAAFAAPFLLFAAAATASSRWLLLTIRTWRYRTGCIGCRRSRTLRHDPQLYLQLRHTAPVDNHNASGIDAARVDQIILGAICSRLAFSVATAVADDVALRCRLVLQLDREVVESGLLIVESDVAILVELTRRRCIRTDRSRARRCASATRIHTTNFDCCSYRLAAKALRVDRDRRGSLAAGNRASRNRPVVGRRDHRRALRTVSRKRARAP